MKKSQIQKEKLFGTDGIRGTPGVYPLTDEMIIKIGNGIARFITKGLSPQGIGKKVSPRGLPAGQAGTVPRIVIGKDTRLSGQQIEGLLADAIKKWGIDVLTVGIITTPGLSFLTRDLKADMGMMISASHNKAADNGIKFFNSKGHKLSIKEEARLEDIIFDSLTHKAKKYPQRKKGNIQIIKDAQLRYTKFLACSLKGMSLKGVRIALDCAFGAASPFARRLFEDLGAEVFCINDRPDGESINIGGAIDPTFLKSLVKRTKSDIGIAVDGDGDRGIIINEKAEVLDGDYTLAIIAKYLLKKNKLPKNTIVATVMSNYGLKIAIEKSGGKIITADVGDKFVLESLLKNKLNFGGEQSGHIIFLDYLSTPDGLLTALQILKVMQETKSTLSQLAQCITKFPQILLNVAVKEKMPFEEIPLLNEKVRRFNAQLKDQGRILLRYSGTERLARVMVEGRNKKQIEEIANSLAGQIRQEIGV
ncbi:MAG: phosphoglucosamine mutase [Candidatus Omnitrophota bacterium]